MREVKVPPLPDVPDDVPPSVRAFLEAVKQSLEIREGRIASGTNSRFVTIKDLVDAGVIAQGDIT